MKQLLGLPLPLDALALERDEPYPVREVFPASADWRLLAGIHPEATIFHQPEWAEVIRRTYGLRPRYLVLARSGEPASGLPLFQAGRLWRRRLISLPFSDVAGPLLAHPRDAEGLAAALLRLARAGNFSLIEVRGGATQPAAGFEASQDFFLHVLDLEDDLAVIRSRLHMGTRRSLRIVERGPLRVRTGSEEADVVAFYRLNLLTRRRHGVPPQPYRLFRNMWDLLAPAGLMSLLLAELHGRPVAGIILLRFRDTAYYKYGASDPAHFTLRPNHLLMWQAIEWAKKSGCRRLDLGRTHHASEGLIRFKTSWGADWLPLAYWRCPPTNGHRRLSEGSPGYELLTGCWRRLPLWVTTLGSPFYKHLA